MLNQAELWIAILEDPDPEITGQRRRKGKKVKKRVVLAVVRSVARKQARCQLLLWSVSQFCGEIFVEERGRDVSQISSAGSSCVLCVSFWGSSFLGSCPPTQGLFNFWPILFSFFLFLFFRSWLTEVGVRGGSLSRVTKNTHLLAAMQENSKKWSRCGGGQDFLKPISFSSHFRAPKLGERI